MTWQAIETVPGDEYGVSVIFALPSGEVGPGRSYILQNGNRVYSFDSVWLEADETPTHWMHYPPKPTKAAP